jgi:hypothetical protein
MYEALSFIPSTVKDREVKMEKERGTERELMIKMTMRYHFHITQIAQNFTKYYNPELAWV